MKAILLNLQCGNYSLCSKVRYQEERCQKKAFHYTSRKQADLLYPRNNHSIVINQALHPSLTVRYSYLYAHSVHMHSISIHTSTYHAPCGLYNSRSGGGGTQASFTQNRKQISIACGLYGGCVRISPKVIY